MTSSVVKNLWTGTIVAFAAMAFGSAVAAAKTQLPLSFEAAFDDRGEPPTLHFTAEYLSGQNAHHLEVWRKGQTKLRRLTDGFLETFVFRSGAADPEYQMTVLDRNRKIATRIDRSHLYRVGNFTDWFDLAHGLKHPQQQYALARIATPGGTAKPVEPCDWYSLQGSGSDRLICWSRKYRLPVLIYLKPDQPVVWQIKTISTASIADSTYDIDDSDFVKSDANQDIEND
jgi:hypothetical protein